MEQKFHFIVDSEPELETNDCDDLQDEGEGELGESDEKSERTLKVRLDKWLWAARFFKTRAIAREKVEKGFVFYNGERSKPSREIEVGALLQIRQGRYEKTVIVKGLSTRRRSTDEALQLFEETEDSKLTREQQAAFAWPSHEIQSESAYSPFSEPRERRQSRFLRRSFQRGDQQPPFNESPPRYNDTPRFNEPPPRYHEPRFSPQYGGNAEGRYYPPQASHHSHNNDHRYQDSHYNSRPPRMSDTRYPDPNHSTNRYPDSRYGNGGESRFNNQDNRYNEARHHQSRYNEPRYGHEPRYSNEGRYPQNSRYTENSRYNQHSQHYPHQNSGQHNPQRYPDSYHQEPRYPASRNYGNNISSQQENLRLNNSRYNQRYSEQRNTVKVPKDHPQYQNPSEEIENQE